MLLTSSVANYTKTNRFGPLSVEDHCAGGHEGSQIHVPDTLFGTRAHQVVQPYRLWGSWVSATYYVVYHRVHANIEKLIVSDQSPHQMVHPSRTISHWYWYVPHNQ